MAVEKEKMQGADIGIMAHEGKTNDHLQVSNIPEVDTSTNYAYHTDAENTVWVTNSALM